MSKEALPILYLNMSGEMIYIVEQRLNAQSIEVSKSDKVINDIFSAMFSQNLINEVFKKQKLLSVMVLREMFEKLAHSSIMKLNEQSMNKLFDLMVMVTKYQMFACNTPIDLIQITLNHLNTMYQMSRMEQTIKLIEEAKDKLIITYGQMKQAQLQHIRYTILTFLQDIRTRVSIFLRDGTQENEGSFVIKPEGVVSCECQIPGLIKYFKEKDVTQVEYFPSSAKYVVSLENTGLGLNIYLKESQQNDGSDKRNAEQNDNQIYKSDESVLAEHSSKNELILLAKLIGRNELNAPENEFWLCLESEDNLNQDLNQSKTFAMNELELKEGIHSNKSLENIINELNFEDKREELDSEDTNDLLDLMDS